MFLTRVIRSRTHPIGLHINSHAKLQRIPAVRSRILSSNMPFTVSLQSRGLGHASPLRHEHARCSLQVLRANQRPGRCHFGTSAPEGESRFKFFVLNDRDFDEVWAFVNSYFFPKEPLTTGAQCPNEMDMEDMVLKDVRSGVSVGARDKDTGELVGVRLSSILSSKPKVEPPPEGIHPSVAKVINMLNHLWEAVDVFDDPGVEKIMKSDILTVHTGYNGQGLAKAMVERSEKLAMKEGVDLLYTQPTNLISANIFSHRGYDTRYTIDLDSFLDESGKRVFDTSLMFGNNVIRVMSKRVKSDGSGGAEEN